jgi:GDP-4-dehydro-6-deoxy-D-mannose reductase
VSDVVLVTGARGFAGSHLAEALNASSSVEHLLASPKHRRSEGGASSHVVGWDRQDIDLLDRDRVRTAIADVRPTQIYHLAGMPHVAESWRDTAETLAGNVLVTQHLLDALRRAKVACRILIPGSATVYAASERPITESDPIAPTNPYAVSKLAQEQLALRAVAEDGVDVVITRSFNHTGPRQTPAFVAPSMARQIAMIERGQLAPVIKVGNLDARRDLTDVRDVVRAYVALMQNGASGQIYNVASGVGRSVREILDALRSRSRVPVQIEVDPARMRPNDVPVVIGDHTRLTQATGWQPAVSFDQMLDDLLAYWRSI